MNGRPVIIDTDPGIDDAVAILLALACPEFEIIGLTTVAGNLGIETTTRNAGRVLALAGRGDIPVVAGATAPLVRKGFGTAEIHGDDGLGGVPLPQPTAASREDAVGWMADTFLGRPFGSVDLLALGPLTNIALLLRNHPAAAGRIGRVIAMGGAIEERGNIGPKSEFNIAADPEAADAVFRAGLTLVLVPLDVTRRVRARQPDLARLRSSGQPGAVASADLIDAYFQTTRGGESRPLHDPCVMLLALAPRLFGVDELTLSVDLGDGPDAGALARNEAGVGVNVAMKVDGQAALDLLVERLSHPSADPDLVKLPSRS